MNKKFKKEHGPKTVTRDKERPIFTITQNEQGTFSIRPHVTKLSMKVYTETLTALAQVILQELKYQRDELREIAENHKT